MIEIISGTDRPNSYSSKVAKFVAQIYRDQKVPANVIDLADLQLSDIASGDYYRGAKGGYAQAVERVTKADGLLLIVPEYNGSFPGALKLFIDYWKYPETFENRPMAFVGLGARWGSLRGVEHLQQVVGHRNAYVFPHRVFLSHVKELMKTGGIEDPLILELLQNQTRDFAKFITGLKAQGLDANSKRK